MEPMTYKDAGVSISEQDRFIETIKQINPNIGGFSGTFPLALEGLERPHLVASTDGVGTKVLVGEMMGRLNTLGIDLVAMVVNDLLCCGARPLFFLDYYATGRLDAERATAILEGIVEGCRRARVPLLGGETAEMPGLYDGEQFDLAGFAVGIVDEAKIIDGARVAPGDAIIGLASSGIHSNGLSLARKVFFEKLGLSVNDPCEGLDGTVGDNLLRPTRIYVPQILALIDAIDVKAIANITGGGLTDNVPRVLPENCRAEFDSGAWSVPPVFQVIERAGPVERAEMHRTFNMGLGMIVIVPADQAEPAAARCRDNGVDAAVVGRITQGPRESVIH